MDGKLDGAFLIKLDRDNFDVWYDQMNDILQANELDSLLIVVCI